MQMAFILITSNKISKVLMVQSGVFRTMVIPFDSTKCLSTISFQATNNSYSYRQVVVYFISFLTIKLSVSSDFKVHFVWILRIFVRWKKNYLFG